MYFVLAVEVAVRGSGLTQLMELMDLPLLLEIYAVLQEVAMNGEDLEEVDLAKVMMVE